ncbi:MAG: serine hydrolase [Acidobacteriota bacterium]
MPLSLLSLLTLLALGLGTDPPALETSTARLEAKMPELLREGRVPGLSIAVLDGGKTAWTGAFGVRNAETQEPVEAETVFEAASLSKPVFAFAVLRLVERGELDLDRPLAELLPYPRLEQDERYRKITARHVMSHTSGLPNWGGDPLQMNFAPGDRFNYSGEGFVFLQKTVEKLTGLTLDEVVRREVFEPLEMTLSSYIWQERFEELAAARHGSRGQISPLRREETGNAAASLLTTAGDYARFLEAVLAPKLLTAKQRDLMLGRVTSLEGAWGSNAEAKAKLGWGLGWGLDPVGSGEAFWHWGDNGDAKAFVWVDPGTGRGFVYFANSGDGLSVAPAIVEETIGADSTWAVSWLNYEAHDDPKRRLRLDLVRAFDESTEAGLARYAQLAKQGDLTERIVDRAAYEVLSTAPEAAVRLFERNVKAHPKSGNAHDSLGEALLRAGETSKAAASYRRAAELDPENEGAQRAADWIEVLVEAERKPTQLSRERLASYAGDFGPRHVRLEETGLVYQRDGNPAFPLRPLTADLFALEGMADFRLRFVTNEAGRATKLEGLYLNGNRDESPRDPE